jgi:hypothetical protein
MKPFCAPHARFLQGIAYLFIFYLKTIWHGTSKAIVVPTAVKNVAGSPCADRFDDGVKGL